jgi:uncharacterized protein
VTWKCKLGAHFIFWPDQTGHETDCIIESSKNDAIPVEIKVEMTIAGDYFKNLQYWNKLSGQIPERSFVVYRGDQNQKGGRVIRYINHDPVFELLRRERSKRISKTIPLIIDDASNV